MNSIFERKEYFENYVMEKIAEQMIANDSKLKKEFETRLLEDEDFKKDARARLNFFYERSPYFDDHYRVYPIIKIE